MMKKSLIIAMIAGALFIGGCNQNSKKEADNSEVIKKYGEIVITQKEFDDEIEKLPANYKSYAASEAGKAAILERISLGKMIQKEAKEKGVDKTKKFEQKWEDTKDNFLISYYVEQKIDEVKISDSDLEIEYEKQKEKFKIEAEVNASHILVKVNKNDSEAVKKEKLAKAKDLLAQAQAEGADFAELAKNNSDCPSKSSGGDLGFFTKQKMVKEFADAAFASEVGIYPEIVETQYGYHIIKVNEKKPESYKSFDEVKESLEQELLSKKQNEMYKAWIESLKEKYPETELVAKDDTIKEESANNKEEDKTQNEGEEKNEDKW